MFGIISIDVHYSFLSLGKFTGLKVYLTASESCVYQIPVVEAMYLRDIARNGEMDISPRLEWKSPYDSIVIRGTSYCTHQMFNA